MLPYRIALAGGWIDQPFVNRLNPRPPGSMVVVSLVADQAFADRSGLATSTRKTAQRLWGDSLPNRDPAGLMRDLYAEENKDRAEPSGSQDMAGLIYPGVSRLDYDFRVEAGVFPCHIETNADPAVARWLESVGWLVEVAPRPQGYNPLGVKNLDPAWIERLGISGCECYRSIIGRDARALGASLNECMECWEAILPQTVVHPALRRNLKSLLADYQSCYAGAMYSGCGGGYLIVISEDHVPGALKIRVRL